MNRRWRGVWVLIAAVSGVSAAHAASFDCAKAASPQEKTICSDAKLSALDTQTAAAYRTLLAQLSPDAVKAVRGDQEAWLRFRDTSCPDLHVAVGPTLDLCLREAYTDQLVMLRSWRRVEGVVFYPRLELETVQETRNMTPGYDDPGVGAGRFAWLVIDRPNAVQAAWNKAMLSRVVASSNMQMDAQGPPPTRFDPKGIAGGTYSVNTVLRAANSRYILAEMYQYGYPYGAAHGGSQRVPFAWRLDVGRPLTVQDIFIAGNSWRQPFANMCWQKLAHGPEADMLFLNGDKTAQSFTSRADVDKDSLTFANWLVDGSGITVLYGEYAIAPYAAGILVAHVDWAELRPYLAKGFDPAQLPPPLPQQKPLNDD